MESATTNAPAASIDPGTGAGWTLLTLTIAIPVVSFVGGLFVDFGRDVAFEYYATAAQVSATIFVLILGVAVLTLPHVQRTRRKPYATRLAPALTIQTLTTLGAALWAVGANLSSTFLCLTVALMLAVQVVGGTFFTFVAAVPELLD